MGIVFAGRVSVPRNKRRSYDVFRAHCLIKYIYFGTGAPIYVYICGDAFYIVRMSNRDSCVSVRL